MRCQKLFSKAALAASLAAGPLLLDLACERKAEQAGPVQNQPDNADLSRKVAEADKAAQEHQQLTQDQARQLTAAGLKPGEDLQLTEEQRHLLEQRIKDEKGATTQALLQAILDRDQEIKKLDGRIAKLRSELPKPHTARENENHYGLAMAFLRSKGVPEEKARTLISRVNIMEELRPGWQVYQSYGNGTYMTTVTQGNADISPGEFVKQARLKVEGERDQARSEAENLGHEVENLTVAKAETEAQVADLTSKTEAQARHMNSVHYLVGEKRQLEKAGVIVVPVFARDRMGPNAVALRFDRDLPLDGGDPEVTIRAAEAGLPKIAKLTVVPGSLVRDQHYAVTYAPDGSSATVKILDAERLRNDRVVFALSQ
ncbi:MAG TPA: hypothetical protein VJ483_00330 [Holophagaceae bacterium]|nr:hypothetical protein [Holophagaceae bacterium]